jgi:DNA-binding response OmpR family regulator
MQRQVPGQDAAPVAVVIEDDPDVRGILAAVLAADGFDVVECADGFAGVAAVEAHRPVLTTCDIHMPGMDGYAVLKRIRTFDDSYVIMISSLSAEIDVVAALEAGADDYLTKPFSPRELRARVHAMLRRAHPGQPVPTGAAPVPTAVAPPVPEPEPVPAPAPPTATSPTPSPLQSPTPSPTTAPAPAADWLVVRGLELHPPTRTTLLDDRPLSLLPAEFDLLATLAATPGGTRTAEELRSTLGLDQAALERATIGLHRTLGPGWVVVVPGTGLRLRP